MAKKVWRKLGKTIRKLAAPCLDDGQRFVEREHLYRIKTMMKTGDWQEPLRLPLAEFYIPAAFDLTKPFILFSSHADSRYRKYRFSKYNSQEAEIDMPNLAVMYFLSVCHALPSTETFIMPKVWRYTVRRPGPMKPCCRYLRTKS